MSPFWKNVNDELQYQGMSIKTLSLLTGIPYTTITNGKNRPDSMPAADVALKISRVLNKPLERLLGENTNPKQIKKSEETLHLYKKYEPLILNLEKCSPKMQDAFIRMVNIMVSEK